VAWVYMQPASRPALSSYCDATQWNAPLHHRVTAALEAGQVHSDRRDVFPAVVQTCKVVLLRDCP
jgi:hypothetical protein